MRNLYLLLMISGFAQAQIINFPDPAFKAKLLTSTATNNIAFNTSFESIAIDADSDGNISIQEAQVIRQLDISQAGISDLSGIENFTSLVYFECNGNTIPNIDFSEFNTLKYLDCSYNLLTNLLIPNSLENLVAKNNQLTTIDLSGHIDTFVHINLDNNQLTELTVSDVELLYVNDNQLATINLSGFYYELECMNNSLTVLDLSNCYFNIFQLHTRFEGNPISLVITKNGIFNDGKLDVSSFEGAFAQEIYICADENDIDVMQQSLNTLNMTNWMVGSYCSFTPGGGYNTINGTALYDFNNNGCDSGDIQNDFIKVTINDGSNIGSAFSSAGGYHFYTNTGNFTITPTIENPAWFTSTPPSTTVNFPVNNNSVATQDFCITANGIHPDVEVVIAPYLAASPGFDAVYKIVYRNKGNQTLSGTVDFTYDDSILDLVASTPTADSQSSGLLSYNYSNLLPFEDRSILVTLNVNGPMETPPVNNDDVLVFTATVNPVSGDELPTDNAYTYNQIVVGSFDPNDKVCIEGNTVNPENIGGYLHYMINFENTGTAPAQNIVIKDIIDTTQFDINTLQVMNSSHPMDVRIDGNKVEFIFQNIMLPSAISNPIGGHGNVLFKIKTLPALPIGTMVSNTANIYFDYNHPIETNEARTTFSQLSTKDFKADSSVAVYPNPVKNQVHIEAKSNIKSVQVFDIQGRILEVLSENKTKSILDISAKPKGIYFLKITTADGVTIEKIIKD